MKDYLVLLLLTPTIFIANAQNFKPDILATIIEKAKTSHSDALIIYQDGKLLHEDYYGNDNKPVYIASAGKSLVSMAIGKLLDDGLIDSLDQPIHTFFPEWRQGQKKNITIRMLLNHTSGLQDFPNASLELEPAPDWQVENVIQLALSAELQSKPGQHVFYSNKATALLGGIIEKASGKRMDDYFREAFFDKMDITEYDWIRDKSGNPTAHGAFVIRPADLLKFGEVMLNEGRYKGKRILSSQWINESTQQAGSELIPLWGYLWWRLPAWGKRIIDGEIISEWNVEQLDPELIVQLSPLKGKPYESREAFNTALKKQLGEDWLSILREKIPHYIRVSKRIFSKEQIGFYASGHRGNYLVVIPEHKIVAVRCAGPQGFNYSTDFFNDFVDLIGKLGN